MSYQHKREPLTKDEANRLINACRTMEENLVIFSLLDTGLRIHELAHLGRTNVDWQGHRLIVMGKGDPGTREKKRRTIPLTGRLQAILEPCLASQDRVGLTVRTMQRLVKRVANRAGISRKCSPHVLRHTFAVHALQSGLSLPALQKILGHARLETTAIYLNLSPEEAIREFQEKIGRNS